MTVYLDHAATTPILPEAAAAMTALLGRVGNASSLHASGREARRVVEESRERIAKALSCRPGEVVFTSGGTESDNLAIKGLFWVAPRRGPASRAHPEHAHRAPRRARPAATGSAHEGAKVELIAVDRQGRLDVDGVPRRRRVRPRERRAGDGDVGQQRGRHRPADRRGRRDRPRPRHPRAHRRGPGARPAAARLRRRRVSTR